MLAVFACHIMLTNDTRKTAPMLRIQGFWFQELGFNIGDPVLVKCEEGKLIIMADTAMAQLKEVEKAFMEEETKKLQQKFQKEKKALRERFVAERQADYCMVAEGTGCDSMGKIYMVGAMKGGVGKSVTAFNLVYSLQKKGKKVLAVDFDPQSNLTTCFGAEDADVAIGDLMMNVIEEEDLPEREEYIWERDGVDFILSSIGLSAVEAKLRLEMGMEKMLSAILEPLREDYDYILIDTSPSLGALNINAMAAADEVIVTVNPQLLVIKGLEDFLRTVKKIKSRINERLDVAGILLTMCDARTILCKTITEQVQEAFQGQVRIFGSKIPNTVKVGESVFYSEPLIEYAPESNACKAYGRLAGEVIAYEG